MKTRYFGGLFLFVAVLMTAMTVCAASLTWDANTGTTGAQDGSGNWDTTSTNWWTTGLANTAWNNATPDSATIGVGGTAGTVTLTTGITVGDITFGNTGSGNYTVTGNTLTFSSPSTITVNKTATISSSLGGGSLVIQAGTRTLTLSGPNLNAISNITVSSGSLNLSASGGGNAYTITGTYTVGGIMRLVTAGTMNSPVVINTGGSLITEYGVSTAGPFTLNGLISGGGNLALVGNGSTYTIGCTNSTFTGKTTLLANNSVSSLTVSNLANAGVASALGAPTGTNATIEIGHGVLIYAGAGDTCNRPFRLMDAISTANNGNDEIRQSGSGALTLSGNITNTFTAANAYLALSGGATGEISGTISDGASYPTPLVKQGSGTWVLSGTNTYTGPTTVNQGTLRVARSSAFGSGALLIDVGASVGAIFESCMNLIRDSGTNAAQMRMNGNANAYSCSGFSARGGNITVQFGAASPESLVWGVGNFKPGGKSVLVLNASTADSTLDFKNPIDLNGTTRSFEVDAATAILDGTIANSTGTAGLNMYGAGTLVLNKDNTYNGATYVYGGALRLMTANAVPGGIGASGGTANVQVGVGNSGGVIELGYNDFTRALGSGATQFCWYNGQSGGFSAYGANHYVNLGGAGVTITWGGSMVHQNQALILGSPTASAQIDFQNPMDFNTYVGIVQVDDNPNSTNDQALLSGVLSNGGLLKTGAGRLIISNNNTYASGTTISNGTLTVAHANALGTSGTITVISNATLEVSSGVTFTRAVTFNAGATLSGQGTFVTNNWTTPAGLILKPGSPTGTLTIDVGGAGKTLTLGANNTLNYVIQPDGTTCGKLQVTGALNISDSTARIVVTGTAPASGTSVVLAQGTSLVGQFLAGNVDLTGLLNSSKCTIQYTSTQVILKNSRKGLVLEVL